MVTQELIKNNPVFTPEQCDDLIDIFTTFVHPKTKVFQLDDLISTMNTIKQGEAHEIILRILEGIYKEFPGNTLNFDSFLTELTKRIVELVRLPLGKLFLTCRGTFRLQRERRRSSN